MTTVVRGTNDKPVASELLASLFESYEDADDDQLFIGYPITTAADGHHPIDALLVSRRRGVVVFDIVEGTDLSGADERQDAAWTRVEVKLKAHQGLVRQRQLIVPINTVTYAPAVSTRGDSTHPIANDTTLMGSLERFEWPGSTEEDFRAVLSALQSLSGIRRTATTRATTREDSRGSKLKRLEGSIATLDAQQSRAVIETTSDVQRLRGLAGSGKTVVLALKAAYLHAQHPEWNIAVTFNTRSLRAQFTRFINNFTIENTGDEPDWAQVHVLQAWGASGGGNSEGMYHRFCMENDVTYHDFGSAKRLYGSVAALEGVCETALQEVHKPRQVYDAILVDEAQDLPPSFLRLCYNMLGDEKRLIYAYDELQTLNGSGLPPAEEIFGTDGSGRPMVSFADEPPKSNRDIILEKCYRNSRPVLVTAHALGFGVYRLAAPGETTGLVQMFEQKSLWEEIGYHVVGGELADNEWVSLARDGESSPKFLEEHSPVDDLVQFRQFGTASEQAEWVAQQILENLTEDELAPNDIMVINPDPFTTRANVGQVRLALLDRGIQSHLSGVDVSADVFFRTDVNSVTFTGIHRAKGNEAGMVYIINAEESYAANANLAQIRNRLFTAITRSKAWVRVCGVGGAMAALTNEFELAKTSDFALNFRFPTEAERDSLRILHRDKSKAEQARAQKYGKSLGDLVRDLENRDLYAEDLDPDIVRRLREVLGDDV